MNVLHSVCQGIWKTQHWPQDRNRSVFIPVPKKGNVKECSDYRTTALISYASKVMLKILLARLQQYQNFKICKIDQELHRSKRSHCQHLLEHRKSKVIKKKSISTSWTTLKPLNRWITRNCGKFLKRW